jgi:hypothetical protein
LGGEALQKLLIVERIDPVDLNQMLDVPQQIRRCTAHGFPLARMQPCFQYSFRVSPRSDVFNYLCKPRRDVLGTSGREHVLVCQQPMQENGMLLRTDNRRVGRSVEEIRGKRRNLPRRSGTYQQWSRIPTGIVELRQTSMWRSSPENGSANPLNNHYMA